MQAGFHSHCFIDMSCHTGICYQAPFAPHRSEVTITSKKQKRRVNSHYLTLALYSPCAPLCALTPQEKKSVWLRVCFNHLQLWKLFSSTKNKAKYIYIYILRFMQTNHMLLLIPKHQHQITAVILLPDNKPQQPREHGLLISISITA